MIFCFSGTGNSLWVAYWLSKKTDDEICMMTDDRANEKLEFCTECERIGFIFPVYGWNMPSVVRDFISRLPFPEEGEKPYVYAVFTCGDDTGRTDRELAKALKERGWTLNAAFSVTMRNTYVGLPGFDIDSTEVEKEKQISAQRRVETHIVETVSRKALSAPNDVHHGAFPWLKTYVIGKFFHRFLTSPRDFRVNSEICKRCERCKRVCPMENISVTKNGTPKWREHCTLCMACYHICPRHAIAHGRFTQGKGQVRIIENRF